MYLKCVVLLFFINYLRLSSYLPKTYIRPVLTSLLTAIFIIFSTWLYDSWTSEFHMEESFGGKEIGELST